MARLKGFQELVSVDEALKRFLDETRFKPKKVRLPLQSCLNRVLAEDITACMDLPRTDRSMVDGYAVDGARTSEATQSKPRVFRLTNSETITGNQTKRIWTGNSLPKGANAAIMLENTRKSRNEVEVWSPVTPWENVSKKGEDMQKGQIALTARKRLKPQHLGLAAALGVTEIDVFEKPKIAVLATGNELAERGTKLRRDQIFDSNRLVLSALCTELGAETFDLGIAGDELDEISARLRRGLEKADAVITSGGTSVGAADLVPDAVNGLGKPGVIVHGVAMRPGMPTALAIVKQKPILVLPGNPVAAILSFETFGRPLVSKLLGLKHTESRPVVKARMTKKTTTTLGRKNLVRVRVFQENSDFLAEPISARGSGLISTMTRANGYVIVSEDSEGLDEGDVVLVSMFDDLEVI